MRRVLIVILTCGLLGAFAWAVSARHANDEARDASALPMRAAPASTREGLPPERPLDDAFRKAMEADTTAAPESGDGVSMRRR